MRIKPIRTDEDYDEAIIFLRELLASDPAPGTPGDDRIEVLTALIENYESEHFPLEQPTAIEAIQFRMEQAGLRQADLVPYIGSPSRVSEVLADKRPLTIEMMRRLEEGLGIPAKVLIRKPVEQGDNIYLHWDKKLFAEMKKRGYFVNINSNTSSNVLQQFFGTIQSHSPTFALHRQSSYRASIASNTQALEAWHTRVLQKAQAITLPTAYRQDSVTEEYMRKIVKLSVHKDGPVQARQALADKGIILIIEPHLSGTKLDGAALKLDSGAPVIGLTLRHDRIDNFWFTLLHELAHISLHLDSSEHDFIDELDEFKGEKLSEVEKEADELAGEMLVPRREWLISPARILPNVLAAQNLAHELGIDVAIVAGKIRYEHGNWSYLNKLVSERRTRQLFEDYPEES